MERRIRNSAKALVVVESRVLVLRIRTAEKEFYILPGGGQQPDELLIDAVKRECAEETGIDVAPRELAFVVESLRGEPFHRVDLVFTCDYLDVAKEAVAHEDKDQIGIAWLSIENLMNEPLYPRKLRSQIVKLHRKGSIEVYLGVENTNSDSRNSILDSASREP